MRLAKQEELDICVGNDQEVDKDTYKRKYASNNNALHTDRQNNK